MIERRTFDPSLTSIFAAVWRHWVTVSFAIILGALLSLAAYLLVTPSYEATTSLLIGQSASNTETPDPAKRSADFVNSQARIAESDEVVRAAIERVGMANLDLREQTQLDGFGGKLRAMVRQVRGLSPEDHKPIDPMDIAVAQLNKSIKVNTEPNTYVLKISFRHPDREIAARFTNALAEAFMERQMKLLDKPGAISFFRVQTARFDAEVEKQSAQFENFVKTGHIYSIDDQRSLLLKRASELQAALSTTRGQLADKMGQKAALQNQLKLLKPVTGSPFVLSFVESLSTVDHNGNTVTPRGEGGRTQGGGDAPPLLMVKVFQDAMAAFRMADAEILGLQEVAKQQTEELNKINQELSGLLANQAEFERLKRGVALATYNAEQYAKRAMEEQINEDFRAAKLSNVRVIQRASAPLKAAFPNGIIFIGLGILFGAFAGIGLALLRETLAERAAMRDGTFAYAHVGLGPATSWWRQDRG